MHKYPVILLVGAAIFMDAILFAERVDTCCVWNDYLPRYVFLFFLARFLTRRKQVASLAASVAHSGLIAWIISSTPTGASS